ncbi:MAG TPA: prolipoprotein diacylglyceryl transferase family protein [Desulfomonilaceae bacterium]|nr:prolipoprotein diacylglyceryl transferase family protein [Desulfomonilaceae bacterium]
MINITFVAVIAIFLGLLFRWSFNALLREEWQVIASIPMSKEGPNTWQGLNITSYGLILGGATVAGVMVILILLGAVGVPAQMTILAIGSLLMVCIPAAKIMAVLVEKKPGTFTVAGAVFVGVFAAPPLVWGLGKVFGPSPDLGVRLPAILAAPAVAYAMGEGIGRLACISFGCCYGKPLSECSVLTRKLLGSWAFVFSGKTKKIAYERGLDGVAVVPIQAMTAVANTSVGLVGVLLFLNSYYSTALILSLVVAQLWRVWSETLRADYRGEGRISAYQIMAIISILFVMGVAYILPAATASQPLPPPDLTAGLVSLWSPEVILFLQAVGMATFLFYGRSTVTGSTMSFHVFKQRI